MGRNGTMAALHRGCLYCFGVALDFYIVRLWLAPAALCIFEQANYWPGKVPDPTKCCLAHGTHWTEPCTIAENHCFGGTADIHFTVFLRSFSLVMNQVMSQTMDCLSPKLNRRSTTAFGSNEPEFVTGCAAFKHEKLCKMARAY